MDESPERESETRADLTTQVHPKEMSQLQTKQVPLPIVVATNVPPPPAAADSTEKTSTRLVSEHSFHL